MRPQSTRNAPPCLPCRHVLSLLALLLFCAFLTHAADQPKEDLPPLFDEGLLPQRAAAAFFGTSSGINAPLQKAIVLAVEHETGWLEFDPPVRGEALTPYMAASVLLGSVPGNAPAFNTSLMLQTGDFLNCWSLEDPTRFRPLDGVLNAIRDDVPLASLTDKTPAAVEEAFIFQDALLKTLRAPPEVLDRVAQSNFTIEELQAHPGQYRGKVLRLHGHLRRIRLIDAPPRLRQFGAPKLYEVWVVVKSGEVWRQVCLLTPVSFGLAPTNDPPQGIELALTGYFFKKFRYGKGSGVAGQPDGSVPLLLGHVTPIVGQEVRATTAVATLLSAGDGQTRGSLTQALLLRAGEQAQCWVIEDPSRVPPLDWRYLDGIKDGRALPRDIDKGGIIDPKNDEQLEVFAYFDAISKAHRTKLELFEASVRPEVTFAHLHNEPQHYRGQVVRIEGMLRRVRRFDPFLIEKQAGIKDVYEVWLVNDKFSKADTVNPVCLICTQLPPGVKVTEEVQGMLPAAFVGYFFKKYRYKAMEAKTDKEFRVAPLLIGRLVLPKKTVEADTSWPTMLVPFILLTLAGTFVVVFLMTWGFRRADRRVLARVDAVAPPFVSASEVDPGESAPKEMGPPPEQERRI